MSPRFPFRTVQQFNTPASRPDSSPPTPRTHPYHTNSFLAGPFFLSTSPDKTHCASRTVSSRRSIPPTHSRVHTHNPIVTMAQMRGQGSYGIGTQNPFGGSSEADQKDSSPLDAIRAQTSKIEDLMDTLSEPLKPYVVPLPFPGAFEVLTVAPATSRPSADSSSSSPSSRTPSE